MNSSNAIDLLFGGMGKLGPGDDVYTLDVLRCLPKKGFHVVVDAGCGSGRQSFVLAKELNTLIHAVDSHEPFLDELANRAKKIGFGHLVQSHCMDMKDIPIAFPHIDLLWSEGAAYNIGFDRALTTWASALKKHAFAVVSELSWLHEAVPKEAEEFFKSEYPDLRSIPDNVVAAESAGYSVINTYTLPEKAWTEDYYDVLNPRAKRLINHSDPAVAEFAMETLREIEIFDSSNGSYGYTFYVLKRT